jgi:glucosamine--fructose-6-phosphate aminotransferase (isomerizing)
VTRTSDSALPGPPDPWAPSTLPSFRGKPPYLMSEMIAAEPGHAERLLHRLAVDDAFAALSNALRAAADARLPIMATGCGTSEHAAMGIAALLDEALDLPAGRGVRAVQALETLRRPLAEGVLVAISHEGGTHATNEAIRAARAAGARTALITAGGGSPGAALADLVVETGEQDQSWCHTIGFLSPLLVGVALGRQLRGARPDAAAIRALLDVSADARPAADVAAALTNVDRLLVVGSGTDHVTARELALKVAEGAHIPTAAHELETVLHGHLAAADRWTGIILVDTDSSPAATAIRKRAAKVLGAARSLGVAAAAILDETRGEEIPAQETPAGRIVLPHTGRVPGVAGTLLSSAVALQLLTERLARARGVNPDTLGREDPAQAAAHS